MDCSSNIARPVGRARPPRRLFTSSLPPVSSVEAGQVTPTLSPEGAAVAVIDTGAAGGLGHAET